MQKYDNSMYATASPEERNRRSIVRIPYKTWTKISERMTKLDMPEKIDPSVQGFSANIDALSNTGFYFAALEFPEIKKQLDEHWGPKYNIVITGRPQLYGESSREEEITNHELQHSKYDGLSLSAKEELLTLFYKRSDADKLIQKLKKHYRTGTIEDTIEEYYVRMSTDPLNERIWLGAKAMPQSRQWKKIDQILGRIKR